MKTIIKAWNNPHLNIAGRQLAAAAWTAVIWAWVTMTFIGYGFLTDMNRLALTDAMYISLGLLFITFPTTTTLVTIYSICEQIVIDRTN